MIVVGGENLIDYVQSGTENGLPVYTAIPGGSCYNCALAAVRQGQPVAYATPISNDTLGDLLANRLLADGVTLTQPRKTAPTSLAVVSVVASIPSYQFYRQGTAERLVNLDSIRNSVPAQTRIFHIGSLALIDGADAQAWEDYFMQCGDLGILTSLDPNARPIVVQDRAPYVDRLMRMIKAADILKLSDEDLEYLLPDTDIDAAFAEICDIATAGIIVLTRGSQGARVFHNGALFDVPSAVANPLVDTVGAGDTFMGTLLAEINQLDVTTAADLRRLDQQRVGAIISKAAIAAAKNCENAGCNPPYLHDLQ